MLRTYTCKYESTYVCMLEEQITFISVIVPHTTVCLPSEVITEIHTKSWYLSYDILRSVIHHVHLQGII